MTPHIFSLTTHRLFQTQLALLLLSLAAASSGAAALVLEAFDISPIVGNGQWHD